MRNLEYCTYFPRKKWMFLFFLMCFGFIMSCSSEAPKSEKKSEIDTPEFHTDAGDQAIEDNDLKEAEKSYTRALELEPNYSAALSGKALVIVMRANRPGKSEKQKTEALQKANELLEKAEENAKTKKEKARIQNDAIRILVTVQLPKEEWYEEAKEHFEKAKELTPDAPAPYFYMAKAEAVRFDYGEATKLYQKVLDLDKGYTKEANQELEMIQKIQRAAPGSKFGKTIAFVKKITRADTAGLFIAELRLERLYKSRKITYETSEFAAPESATANPGRTKKNKPLVLDIGTSPLKSAIEKVIRLNIKGLEVNADHKFYPNEAITRGEFAMMIQDIIIKVTNDKKLATKYIGEKSPFPDVRPDHHYYNAVRVVVASGFMAVEDKTTRQFDPTGPVSGADALLTIRELKDSIRKW